MQILLIEKSQKCGCGSQGKVEKFLYKNFINEILKMLLFPQEI